MSVAAVLGIVLIVGFVGVALVARIAWRSRMRESMPNSDWRQAVQTDPAPSSEWNKDSRAVARLAVNVKRFVHRKEVVFDARPAAETTAQNYPETLMTILLILGFVLLLIAIIAVHDLTQRNHAVTRNFPVIGHFRYFFEEMGQPLRQYLFAGDLEERPYNRVTRSWVYASAKGQNNYVGFGSQVDHDEPGRMHILPAMFPTLIRGRGELPMPRLIGAKCAEPYQPRRFANISGMSFGALSPNAVRALSRGAKLAGCYMGTGEGSMSPYHVEGGGDILYQIGPAKFGCRTDDGRFDDEKAAAIMALPQHPRRRVDAVARDRNLAMAPSHAMVARARCGKLRPINFTGASLPV